jgi:Arc/MetJ-type ribon-helix-helix transcriptional regulator
MTIHLPEELENNILAAVHSGRYASLDDAMTKAASLLVERLKQEHTQATPARKPLTEEQLEKQLIESGFLASVPPPISTATTPWKFEPVKIEGEPLSETVIRERR